MDSRKEKTKRILKSLQFILPSAVAVFLIVIGLLTLPTVPTELPERLVYEPQTSAPTAAPAYTAAPPSDEPVFSPEPSESTEPLVTDAPTQEPTLAPENTPEPSETLTAAPTAAQTSAPTPGSTAAPTSAPTAEPTAAPTAVPTETPGKYRDGDYTATAQCRDTELFDYTVEVTVKVRSGDIAEVSVRKKNDNSEDPDTNDVFLQMAVRGENGCVGVPASIVAHNGVDGVDVVSGATFSSNAIITAAGRALQSAQKSGHAPNEHALLPRKRPLLEETER